MECQSEMNRLELSHQKNNCVSQEDICTAERLEMKRGRSIWHGARTNERMSEMKKTNVVATGIFALLVIAAIAVWAAAMIVAPAALVKFCWLYLVA